MGRWTDKYERKILDADLRSAQAWLRKWRAEGRWVDQIGNDVIVQDWHTLTDNAKQMLRNLQPHLSAAILLEKHSRKEPPP